MKPLNPAERALFAAPGTVPLVASGPDGDAYQVRSTGRYLVLRRGKWKPDRPAEDEVPSGEVWTTTLEYALHLVDRELNPLPACTCTSCVAKRAPSS